MVEHIDGAKTAGDIAAAGLAFGTLAQILPQIAAVLSITWTVLRIGEWVHLKFIKR